MASANIVIELRGIPEWLAEAHRLLAVELRRMADAEADPRVARRLRELALEWELGIVR